jgi:hypothetical protein
MEHGSHLVDVLDREGNITGQKKRVDIDKMRDIHHAVYTLMITPTGELVLSCIPNRKDLPNVYADMLATTVNTIRRHKESAEEAARRAISRELFIDDPDITFLGEGMQTFSDGRMNFVSGFCMVGEAPDTYSLTDIDGLVTMPFKQVHRDMREHKHHFAPTLVKFWQEWGDRLPV